MIDLSESIEVIDLCSDMIVPVFVDQNGDWPGAVLAASKLERAEVNVITNGGLTAITVFSDNPDEYCSPWWAQQIGHRRHFLGRY